MNSHPLGSISRLVRSAKTHGVLAAEAAAIAFELDGRRLRGEAAVFRATARNHRIRQLEISAKIAAIEALSKPNRLGSV